MASNENNQPLPSKQRWLIFNPPWDLCLVLLLATTVQLIAFDPYINMYDEGIILEGAEGVLHGKIPYRDFWTMYGPAQFYIASWLYSIFGPANLTVRAIGILAKAATTGLSYLLIARFAPRLYSAAASIIVCVLLVSVRWDSSPVFPALALSLASMLLADKGVIKGPKYLFMAGMVTGLATSFRHDLGAYSAISIGLSIVIPQVFRAGRPPSRAAVSSAGFHLIVYGLGVMTVLVPIAGLLVSAVPLSDLYADLIYSPSTVYGAFRSLPFPEFRSLLGNDQSPGDLGPFVVYAPFLVVTLAILAELLQQQRRNDSTTHPPVSSRLIFMVLLTCLLFTLKGVVRVSAVHMIQSVVLSVVVLAIYSLRIDWRPLKSQLILLPLFAIALLLIGRQTWDGAKFIASGTLEMSSHRNTVLARCIHPVLPRMRCVGVEIDYLSAARFIMENSKAGDPIYVGSGRHDKIFINAIGMYFMAERPPATKWYELHPGIQTQAGVQREMIEEMRKIPPKLVVLDNRWDGFEEPNNSRLATGASLLDEYFRSSYREIRRFGTLQILAPR